MRKYIFELRYVAASDAVRFRLQESVQCVADYSSP